MASCTAVIGAMTTSSWSWMPLDPFGLVTPVTSKLVPSMRTDWPTGSWPAKRLATTVGPRITDAPVLLDVLGA